MLTTGVRMPKPSRAGSRTNRFRAGYGRVSDSRIAILRTGITNQLVISEIDNDELNKEEKFSLDAEGGMSYLLNIFLPGRPRPVSWNFSAMTTAELEATRQFFNYLFDLADPVVRERDRVANAAFEKGDDSYVRVYRPVPQFIKRERAKREHAQGVHVGPENPPQGDGSGGDLTGGLSGDGAELVDGQPQEGGIQDDWPEIDQP
jgi:hypothetical protein